MSSHNLNDKVLSTIKRFAMLTGGEKILVGLSGGPDSVCLLYILHCLKDSLSLNLSALYIDHGLRPDEAREEIEFCKRLCEKLSIKFLVKSIDVKLYVKEQGLSIQEAARELRFQTFESVAQELNAQKIALGHILDDQLETFFMRFFSGSGPKGLSGIPPIRGPIIRPLLETDRKDVEEFLNKEHISFIVDSSNLKKNYLRNRLRLSLIPELKKLFPQIAQTVSRTMHILREEEKYFDIIVTKTIMKLISRKTNARTELFLSPLEAMDKVILRRVLRKAIDETKGLRGIEFVHIESIIDLVKHGRRGGRLFLPRGLRVIKDYSTLILTSEMLPKLNSVNLSIPGTVVLKEIGAVIKASIENKIETYGNTRTLAVFDAEKTGLELTVRARANGDFFYPMGFGKRKKIQDYFVDEKVPRDERDAIPIVVKGNDIVWIAGYRGDERFKVLDSTERFLKIEINKLL